MKLKTNSIHFNNTLRIDSQVTSLTPYKDLYIIVVLLEALQKGNMSVPLKAHFKKKDLMVFYQHFRQLPYTVLALHKSQENEVCWQHNSWAWLPTDDTSSFLTLLPT